MDLIAVLAGELKQPTGRVQTTVELMDGGATVPFIARYRKEMTGGMDEEVLRTLEERLNYLRNLEKRKQEVTASIDEQGKMTEEITTALAQAITLAQVEDIYRPYKQKRKTRASIAREKGLAPLADIIAAGDNARALAEAPDYINEEKGVLTADDALQGAMDIFAEDISDEPSYRETLRRLIREKGEITAKGEPGDHNYTDYIEFSELIGKIPPHRILAINRGEKENFLKVNISIEDSKALDIIKKHYQADTLPDETYTIKAINDSWKRLLFPSLEREIRTELTERAERQAINIFGLNLQQLLLQPPVSGKTIIAVDPAFRTGCKTAVIDHTGKLLEVLVIYPTPPQNKVEEAEKEMIRLTAKYNANAVVIGNGTASRETESFIAETISKYKLPLEYIIVNEAGASVYSASKLAKEELPGLDVSYRGAVSIGRRLQDPLAELVKIDPKAIGVGQYQHDVDQKLLAGTLDGVVETCVNRVGVDVNTASPSLLSYVAGLDKKTATAVVAWREDNGTFNSRSQLLKVKGLGDKKYQQCAGFLRIRDGKDFLDNTAVHPESYPAARHFASMSHEEINEILNNGSRLAQAAQEAEIGVPTLKDILNELLKPGRDVREDLPKPVFRRDILDMDSLTPGMILDGTVRNIVDFGVFVDIGVHQDGMVHISQMADRYIKHPSEVAKVGDNVKVRVISVDMVRKRIALSMRSE